MLRPWNDSMLDVSSSENYVYVAGQIWDSVYGLKANGAFDAFVGKFDLDGNKIWALQIGEPNANLSEVATGIAADESDNVYVCAMVGDGSSDPGYMGTPFITKIDKDGNIVWKKNLTQGATSNKILIGSDGNIYAVTTNGLSYLHVYTSDGILVNTCQYGGYLTNIGESLGSIYLTGYAGETGKVSKYEKSSNTLTELQTITNVFTSSQIIDSAGNYYIGGSVTPIRGSQISGESYAGLNGELGIVGGLYNMDCFLVKYSSKNELVWTRQFGSSADDLLLSTAIDSQGNIYVGGAAGVVNRTGDMFLKVFDTEGNLAWDKTWDSNDTGGRLKAFTQDSNGFIYAVGEVKGDLNGELGSSTEKPDGYIFKFAYVTGTKKNDTLTGSSGADEIYALNGNDTVYAGEGDDVIIGGDGKGNDNYFGGDGTDKIKFLSATWGISVDLGNGTAVSLINPKNKKNKDASGTGKDTLNSIENLISGNFSDILVGSAVDNQIEGMDGGDNIDGREGNDTLLGGNGNDTLIGGLGNDSLDGGSSNDTADFSNNTLAVIARLDTGLATIGNETDALISIENLIGGKGHDQLVGNPDNNIISGGVGNDILNGGNGNDSLDGGEGLDAADYSDKITSVSVTLNGTNSAVVKVNNVAEDTIKNIENIIGGSGNDTLTGDNLGNTLKGGDGNDTLNGAAGIDTINGDAGNDVLMGGAGNDVINGGNNVDTASFADKTTRVVIVLSAGAGTATIGTETDTLTGIENLTGGSGNDTFTGDDNDNVLTGGAGNDTLDGGGGNDTLIGGTGNDVYLLSNEYQGTTTIVEAANAGIDSVYGDLETYYLGQNIENYYNDLCLTDRYVVITGNEMNNIVSTYSADTNSAEKFLGLGGNDTLIGGLGNDYLIGGTGNDVLLGGAGADRFVFDSALNIKLNLDKITDFKRSDGDKLVLDTAVFTNLNSGFSSSNLVVNATGKAIESDDFLIFNSKNSTLYYDADGNGKSAAVAIAVLTGVKELVASDFVIGLA